MKSELVSIIVPVYNAEKTLHRCVNSILSQTYKNTEIILVNDGSVDSSQEICNAYSVQFPNILFVNKQNRGVSNSRNVGIDYSSGKFILFIDSDDYVCNDYISSLIDLYCKENVMIVQGCRIIHNNKKLSEYTLTKAKYLPQQYCTFLEKEEMFKHGSPYGKLYISEIINNNNIRFDESVHNYEDLLFFLDYLQYTEEIIVSDIANYCYCISSSGLHTKYYSVEEELYLYRKYKEKMTKYDSKYRSDKLYAYSLKILCRATKSLLYKKGEFNYKNLQNIRTELMKANFSKMYLSLKEKIFVYLIKHTCIF